MEAKKHLSVLDTPSEEEAKVLGRRCVLSALSAAALVGCFTGDTSGQDAGDASSSDEPEAAPTCDSSLGTRVGAETDFPVGTWSLVGQFIVAQDTNGFFAFSAICTHQGCPVDPPASDGSTFCPCHGSQFDGNGNVLVGPAFSPLRHYAVNICNGDVYVDRNTFVSQSTRTPPV